MLAFTDTHCHLNLAQYDSDRETVLNHAWQAGLVLILNPGIDLKTSQEAIKLAKAYPDRIYAAVGIHPNYGNSWTPVTLDALREQAQDSVVVAIGEIGLDYYRQYTAFNQ